MINQKGVVVFEIEKDERTYSFHVPMGAPLGQAYDCAFEVMNKLLELAKESAKAADPKKDEAATEPEVVSEPAA